MSLTEKRKAMKKSFLYVISCFMCTLVSTSIVFAQKIDNLAHPTNPVECCADANPKTMLPNDT